MVHLKASLLSLKTLKSFSSSISFKVGAMTTNQERKVQEKHTLSWKVRVQPQHRRFLNGGFRLWPTTPFQLFKPLISHWSSISLSLEEHQYFLFITTQLPVQVLANKNSFQGSSIPTLRNEASIKASMGFLA